jgi:tyrosinase
MAKEASVDRLTDRPSGIARRTLLQSAGAAALVLGLPATATGQAKRHRRPNIHSPAGAKSLASYKKAIRAMLALPATDARNWYRIAIAHDLDCPHGNWWFLPWHRGYLGWFEQICRELSGDPDFALVYWDWTAEPRIPAEMFEDVLTPGADAFIDSFADFKKQFAPAVAHLDYWQVVRKPDGTFDETSPYAQILARGVRTPEDLWFDIFEDPRGKQFFDLAHARGLTKLNPDLDENAKKAVSLPTLLDALAPKDFVTFASPKALFHGTMMGYGVLEGQPHNNVHNCVGGMSMLHNTGGFMQANLSPIDPIFWLHHANIDRIWDVWTRKQSAGGLPIFPDGAPAKPGDVPPPDSDCAIWAREPLLFFVDAQGRPAPKKTSGDYATIGEFEYDYEPGSGEEVVLAATASVAPARVRTFPARLSIASIAAGKPAHANVSLPANVLDSNARLFARVTVSFKGSMHSVPLRLTVGDAGAGADAPGFAGMLSMFGHHMMSGPVTFLVPLSAPMRTMRASRALRADAPLDITIAQMEMPGHMSQMNGPGATSQASADVLAIAIEVQ